MNQEHYKQMLLAKQRELQESMSRHEDDARESRSAEVEDPIDQVISAEAKATAFQEDTMAEHTLRDVEDALARIEDGTYGTCIDCGEDIPEARLNAVPWAAYCIRDQEKRERETENEQQLDSIS